MAAGKQQQQQPQQGVVAAEHGGVARRLWRVVRAVLYMLRRGLPSGRKLAMDLHLLLHRGKIAGRALGELFLAFHHGHHGHRHAAAFSYAGGSTSGGAGGPFSCRALDPSLAVHEPAPRGRREVEFSCSNTPASSAAVNTGGGLGLGLLGAGKRRRRRKDRDDGFGGGYLHQQQQQYSSSYYDAAEVARMFEMLNDDGDGQSYRLFTDDTAEPATASASASASSAATSATATPSPARLLYWAAVARGGSPAPRSSSRATTPRLAESSPADGAGVDRQADEFIRRFYEQLRAQRSAASTPDYYGYTSAAGASPYVTPRARRPAAVVAAGIA